MCASIGHNWSTLCYFLLSRNCLIRRHYFHFLDHISLVQHQPTHAVGKKVVEGGSCQNEWQYHPANEKTQTVSEPVGVLLLHYSHCDVGRRDLEGVIEEGELLRRVVLHHLVWVLH